MPSESSDRSIDKQLEEIAQKYPEDFRKSLAYYMGAGVPLTPEDPRGWKATVFRLVDLALLGIDSTQSYELVAKT